MKCLSIFLFAFLLSSVSFAQIYKYTNDATGAANTVDPNVTAGVLTRVNGAAVPSSLYSCSTGFCSSGFIAGNGSFYPLSTKGVDVTITPNAGYQMNITSFSVDVRMSSTTGPNILGWAYSLDNGASWIQSGKDTMQLVTTSCGTGNTYTWTPASTIVTSAPIKVGLFFINSYSSTASIQLLNLKVNGVVNNNALPACAAPSPATNFQSVVASPTQTNISFTPPVPAADSFLVIASTASLLTAGPVNGTSYALNSSIGGGTVVYRGTASSFPVLGLNPTQDYYYFIYAYTHNTGCTGGAAYSTALVGNDILPPPVITAEPVDDTACTGTPAYFIVNASNAPGYQWQVLNGATWTDIGSNNGGVYSGYQNSILMVNNVAGLDGTQYRCIALGSSSTNDTSAVVTLHETVAAAVTTQPAAAVACEGAFTYFKIDAAGTANTYQWQVNTGNGFTDIAAGSPYDGAQTDSLSVTAPLASMNGYYYRCVVTGPCGSVASDSAVLSVNSFPAITISHTTPETFCQGDSVVLHAPTGPGLTYQWYFNGSSISGSNVAQYTAKSTGVYRVKVTSAAGCTGFDSLTVTSVAPPQPVITRNGFVNMSTGNFSTYQWYFNNQPISGATAQNYVAPQNGSYFVEVKNSTGCIGRSAAVTVGGTAVSTVTRANEVKMYPNPVRTTIRIEAPVPVTAIVRDMTGKVMLEQKNASVLDLNTLADGVYTITLTDGETGWLMTRQIVKMHE